MAASGGVVCCPAKVAGEANEEAAALKRWQLLGFGGAERERSVQGPWRVSVLVYGVLCVVNVRPSKGQGREGGCTSVQHEGQKNECAKRSHHLLYDTHTLTKKPSNTQAFTAHTYLSYPSPRQARV